MLAGYSDVVQILFRIFSTFQPKVHEKTITYKIKFPMKSKARETVVSLHELRHAVNFLGLLFAALYMSVEVSCILPNTSIFILFGSSMYLTAPVDSSLPNIL